MSQLSRFSGTPAPVSAEGGYADADPIRRSPLLIIWQRRWSVVACLALSILAACAYLTTATPVYEGTAKLAVEQGNQPRMLNDITGGGQSGNWMQTQTELIRSSQILSVVAARPEVLSMETLRGSASPVADLQSRVSATVSPRSDVISISARSTIPRDASAIANVVAVVYQDYVNERRKNTAADVLRILEQQKGAAEKVLATIRDEKIKFVRDTGFLPSSVSPAVGRLGSLSTERNRLEIELTTAESALAAAEAAANDPVSAGLLIESIGSRQGNNSTGDIRAEIRQRQRDLLAATNNYLPGFPDLEKIRQSLKSLQEELAAEDAKFLKAYIAQLGRDVASYRYRMGELNALIGTALAEFRKTNEQALQIETYESEIRRLESQVGNYDSQIRMLDPSKDTNLAANITLMERAPENGPAAPVSPRISSTLSSAILGGLLAGALLAFLRDWMDQRLRNVEEVQQMIGVGVLGVVPHIQGDKSQPYRGTVVQHEPMSDVAESYRTIRTAIYFGVAGTAPRTLLVTSPQPGDGKTTLASNLAIAMAQAGNRVLLIDADFRKPMQHKTFGLSREVGASSVLAGEAELSAAVQATGVDNLDLLPCGPLPANPSEVLNSRPFAELIETMKQRYDQIVIDSPPVLPVTDARILSAVADVTILALRADKSTRKAASYARDVLVSLGGKLLGVVVNDVARRRGAYGYGRGGYMYAYGYGNATRRITPPSRTLVEETSGGNGSH